MREPNCTPIDLLHQGADGVIGVYLLETGDGPRSSTPVPRRATSGCASRWTSRSFGIS